MEEEEQEEETSDLTSSSALLSPSVGCQLTGEKINDLAEVCLQLEGEFRFCHTRLHLKTTRLKAL